MTPRSHRPLVRALAAALFLALALAGCTFPGKASREAAPGSAEALEQQGDQALQGGRPDAAAQFYAQAGRAGLPAGRAGLKLGRALVAQGQWDQAYAVLDQAAKADPKAFEIPLLAGYAALRAGQYEAAAQRLRQAVALRDDSVLGRSLLGVALNRQGKAEEALPEFDKALAVTGPEASILNNKGLALYMLGRYPQAEEALRQAAALDPQARHRNNLGLALCRLGRFPEALEQFRLADGEAAAQNNLGCCYLDAGQPQKAQESFEKALAASPGAYKPASDNLARMGRSAPPKSAETQTPDSQGRPLLQESALTDELAARPGPPQARAAGQVPGQSSVPVPAPGQAQPVAGSGAVKPVVESVSLAPQAPGPAQAQAAQARPEAQAAPPQPAPAQAPGQASGQPERRVATNVTGLESPGELRVLVSAGAPVDPALAAFEPSAEGLAIVLRGAWAFQGQVVNYGAGQLLERVHVEERPDGLLIRLRYKSGAQRPKGPPIVEGIPQGLAVSVPK